MDAVGDLKGALPNGVLPTVHIEVCQKEFSTAKPIDVKNRVQAVFSNCGAGSSNILDLNVAITEFEDVFLKEHIDSLLVCDNEHSSDKVDISKVALEIHVYQLHYEGPAQEELDDDEDLAAANHWLLPATDFHGLWESLIFDSTIKSQLLNYVSTTLLFSDKQVDSNIIAWNRVVLLHGPPGTGKTSLCRALAQKLCVQLSDRYRYGQLVEINSHSLFSKWFSESGKLVMKMFQKIQELIDEKDALVCVLIDEVESLAAARKASQNGAEPSDALRVVNAVLTQLDQIKKNTNVIILTTSNITGAIDLAFVDRADLKQYIGPPSSSAIYMIYRSCLQELMKRGVIVPHEVLMLYSDCEQYDVSCCSSYSMELQKIAQKSEGLSGRALRKLPFIAHAIFVRKPVTTMKHFLTALEQAVEKQFLDQQHLSCD